MSFSQQTPTLSEVLQRMPPVSEGAAVVYVSEFLALLESCTEFSYKGGKKAHLLTFVDKTARVTFADFDNKIQPLIEKHQGKVILVRVGSYNRFNANLQIKTLDSWEAVAVDPSSFKPPLISANKTVTFSKLWLIINKHFGSEGGLPEDSPMRSCLLHIMTRVESSYKDLYKAPAAKIHHGCYYGGLMEHTVNLCELAETVVKKYQHYYPSLSLHKVLFGCIIHDLGKVAEYTFNIAAEHADGTGELSDIKIHQSAHLTNHITFASDLIMQHYPLSGDPALAQELKHIVLAHHGKLEFGSPVKPATMEALIVHMLDMMDATILNPFAAMMRTPVGEMVPQHNIVAQEVRV